MGDPLGTEEEAQSVDLLSRVMLVCRDLSWLNPTNSVNQLSPLVRDWTGGWGVSKETAHLWRNVSALRKGVEFNKI